jgi:hypothetical protein
VEATKWPLILLLIVGAGTFFDTATRLVLDSPVADLRLLRVLLTAYFLLAGIRVIALVLSSRLTGVKMGLVEGLGTVLLGALLWAQWPPPRHLGPV